MSVKAIYDESLPEQDRQPACVMVCPTKARPFGDFDDPDSEVSQVARERGGYELMPEFGYQPFNRCLPPRKPQEIVSKERNPAPSSDQRETAVDAGGWLNRIVNF